MKTGKKVAAVDSGIGRMHEQELTHDHSWAILQPFKSAGMMGFACVELSLTADSLVFVTNSTQ